MNTAIVIHGLQSEAEYFSKEKPSPSNSNWLPWLQNQLNANGILTQTPEMPTPYKPDYKSWSELFERFIIDESVSLVGHSLGGGFIIRWLSEHPHTKVGFVTLVAPWLDTEGRLESDFFNFELRSAVASQCRKMTILSSDNDMKRIDLTVNLCKEKISGVNFVELKDKGHFLKKHMGTEKFPELLQYLGVELTHID